MGSAYQGQAPVGPAEGVSLAVVPPRAEFLDRFDQLVNGMSYYDLAIADNG
jgi:hypothetical protein